jgi:hypothetical protein
MQLLFSLFHCFLRQFCYVAQAGLEFMIILPSFPSARITGMYHHNWPAAMLQALISDKLHIYNYESLKWIKCCGLGSLVLVACVLYVCLLLCEMTAMG